MGPLFRDPGSARGEVQISRVPSQVPSAASETGRGIAIFKVSYLSISNVGPLGSTHASSPFSSKNCNAGFS
jgi:hypothetical protein